MQDATTSQGRKGRGLPRPPRIKWRIQVGFLESMGFTDAEPDGLAGDAAGGVAEEEGGDCGYLLDRKGFVGGGGREPLLRRVANRRCSSSRGPGHRFRHEQVEGNPGSGG